MHVVVLFGGRSAEHDVSCVTAAHVLRALDLDRYTVTVIGIDRSGTWHLAESAMNALGTTLPETLSAEGPEVAASSVLAATSAAGLPVVILPLLHGPQGEDGTVQGLIELADLPYVGSGVLGSAVSMDKAIAKAVLSAADIPQPRYRALQDKDVSPESVAEAVTALGLPVFVKPANMGSSIGVSKARTLEEVERAVRLALDYDRWILIEEAVNGREIEVAVLGNDAPEASVAGEIVPAKEFYDYEDKYVTSGARLLVPAPLSDDASRTVRDLALRVFGTLRGSGLARVDFFYEENGRGFLCNEMNTMPGFTPISMYPKLWEATGVSYSRLIDRLIAFALERHQLQRRNTSR
ncbi:MAG: D-alanine--D-alanine ligase family protein [Ilumatobacteraceae bacterium]